MRRGDTNPARKVGRGMATAGKWCSIPPQERQEVEGVSGSVRLKWGQKEGCLLKFCIPRVQDRGRIGFGWFWPWLAWVVLPRISRIYDE